jgi:hypothetical protein
MTTLVKVIPGSGKLFVGDSLRRTLHLLNGKGEELASLNLGNPPVALDWTEQGMYLTLIGYVAPSDDPQGRYIFIPNTELGFQRPHVLLDQLPRPCDVKRADLNADGREDLVVCHYGNLVGRLSWYEKLASGAYFEHVLHGFPGALCAYVRDFNADNLLDIIVLTAQAQESIVLFINLGRGQFQESPVIRRSPVWGHTYFELADFDGDSRSDLLVVNGDNAEYAAPMKNYHGIRVYSDSGQGQFHESCFFPLNGACKAVARDFDKDGDLDIAAIAFFPNYLQSPEESFVYLRNEGFPSFTAHTIPECTRGRWLVMDVGDLDSDGDEDLVLGAFNQGPETIPIPESLRKRWQTGPSVLILKNNSR